MKNLWVILAGVCGLLAAFFVFREDYENAFIAAAAGAVCWFLNYRQQLRESLPVENEKEESDEETKPDEELRS